MKSRVSLTSRGPFSVGSLVWRDKHGQWVCTLVAKATYALAPGISAPSAEPMPIQEEDGHWDDDPARSVHLPSDVVPFKKAPEVVVVGSAFAPGERPAASVTARVLIESIDKAVEAHAPRFLRDGGVIEEGQRLRRFSLRYEYAAGGPESDNPIGIDISRPDARGRRQVPQILPTVFELGPQTSHAPPIGLGPISASWRARAGKLDEAALAWLAHPARDPLPKAFPASFFQSAPPDQWLHRPLAPNERIVLENLHQKQPRLVMSLSGLEPYAVVVGRQEPVRLWGDLLVIDSDRALCTLTFRGFVTMTSPSDAVRAVVVAVPMGTELSAEAIAAISASLDEFDGDALVEEATHDVPGARLDETLPFTNRRAVLASMSSPSQSALPFSGAPAPAPPPPVSTRKAHTVPIPPAQPSPRPPEPSYPEPAPRFAPPPPAPVRQPSSPDLGLASPPKPPASLLTLMPSDRVQPAMAPPAMVQPAMAPPAMAQPAMAQPVMAQPAMAQPAMAPPAMALPAPVQPREVHPPQEAAAPAAPAAKPLLPGLRAREGTPGARSLAKPAESAPSVQAASDAAAHEERARLARPAPGREPLVRSASPRRRVIIDLLAFEPKIAPRLRGLKRLSEIWAPSVGVRAPQSADEPKRAPQDPDREMVLRALSYGEGQSASEIGRALADSFDDASDLEPPLVLCAGELAPTFDEAEQLRYAVAVASSVAGTDKRTLSALAVAQEALAAPLAPAPETLRNLAKQLEAATSSLALPPRFLATQVERLLVENRKYKRRPVFDTPRVRAELTLSGGEVFPLYVSDAAARSLPLLPSFSVVTLCEVRPREDLVEAQAEALNCVALGRVLYSRASS